MDGERAVPSGKTLVPFQMLLSVVIGQVVICLCFAFVCIHSCLYIMLKVVGYVGNEIM